MLLPKEKILFAVDFNSLGAVPSRLAVDDSYPTEWEASLKRTLALGWERMIPGHPGPGGRLGTRKDMEEQIAFMTDMATEVKKASVAESMQRSQVTSRTSSGTFAAGAATTAAASDANEPRQSKLQARLVAGPFLFRPHPHEGLSVTFGHQGAVLLEGLVMEFDDSRTRP